MFVLRLAFPSAVKPSKVTLYEWPFRSSAEDITWVALVDRLREQTKLKHAKFYVSWHDGEDYCTISNTESLREAIRHMLRYRKDTPPLLFVFPIVPDEECTRLSGFFGGCQLEELPKDFRQYVGQDQCGSSSHVANRETFTHAELVCNQCGMVDWRGDRYACVVCPRIVYCNNCFKQDLHPEHPVLITRDEAPFPSPILQAVRIVASTINTYDSTDEESTPTVSDDDFSRDSVGSFQYQPLPDSILPIDAKVSEAMEQLRDMGFEQDYSELLQIALAEQGDVTSIVERLTN